jgi:hypothetical protein
VPGRLFQELHSLRGGHRAQYLVAFIHQYFLKAYQHDGVVVHNQR